MDEYENYRNNSKIPYDDIPISRNETRSRGSYESGQRSEQKPKTVKFLTSLVAILVIINISLIISTFYYLKTSVVKEVSTNYYTISSTSNISSVASASAKWSTINVGAGRAVTTEYQFYNSSYSRGAGVIYKLSSDGVYMITCYHVIDGYENNVYVMPPSSLVPIKVDVVGYSSQYDIAVLYTSDVSSFDCCTEISVYDSDYLSLGEYVFAIGNPLGTGTSVTAGVISKLNTLIVTESNSYYSREIQIDAAINAGNSGGGLFNYFGDFIGLVNAKLYTYTSGSKSVVVEGVSYAIPGNLVISIAKSIIKNSGSPTCVNLGVTFSHDTDKGVVRENVIIGDEVKEIDKYYVYVSAVSSGSISSGILTVGSYVNSITYVDLDGNTQTIEMLNKYCFEDISFDIMPNSTITFNITNLLSTGDVEVSATSFSTY